MTRSAERLRTAIAPLPRDALLRALCERIEDIAAGRVPETDARDALARHIEWLGGVEEALIDMGDPRAESVGAAVDALSRENDRWM